MEFYYAGKSEFFFNVVVVRTVPKQTVISVILPLSTVLHSPDK
jgi:hypothetical protein